MREAKWRRAAGDAPDEARRNIFDLVTRESASFINSANALAVDAFRRISPREAGYRISEMLIQPLHRRQASKQPGTDVNHRHQPAASARRRRQRGTWYAGSK